MFKIVLLCLVVTTGTRLRADDATASCEPNLYHVNPAAEDPYERLGVEPGQAVTQATARFRVAAAAYRNSPAELNRLAEAYAQIRTDTASGVRVDSSRLPGTALRRAHGKIYGDPSSGRFTVGYGLNSFAQPIMDANLMIREILIQPAIRQRLEAMPEGLRPWFEQFVEYFAKQIRRLGVEGGFEDVVAFNWFGDSRDREDHRRMSQAMRIFVEIFGLTYQRALTDPKGAGFAALKVRLPHLRLPNPGKPRPLLEHLADERDPRTFLRKIVHHLRKPKSRGKAESLLEAGGLYQRSFLVDPAKFLQHILYFATADWTGQELSLIDPNDRRVLDEVLNSLRYVWIDLPTLGRTEPRWFNYASVLFDTQVFMADKIKGLRPGDIPVLPQLTAVELSHPEVLARVRAEREIPRLSDILPWSRNADSTF